MYQEEYKRWLAADLQDADLNPELSKIRITALYMHWSIIVSKK